MRAAINLSRRCLQRSFSGSPAAARKPFASCRLAARPILFKPFKGFFSASARRDNDNDLLYKILGVQPAASLADIKAAYKNLCLKYHPDVSDGKSKKFLEITKAFNFLKDPDERKLFNEMSSDDYKIFVDKWVSLFNTIEKENDYSTSNVVGFLRKSKQANIFQFDRLFVMQDISYSMNKAKVVLSAECLKNFLVSIKNVREVNVNISCYHSGQHHICANKSVEDALLLFEKKDVFPFSEETKHCYPNGLYWHLRESIKGVGGLKFPESTLFVVVTSGYDNFGHGTLSEVCREIYSAKASIVFVAVDMVDIGHLESMVKSAAFGQIVRVSSKAKFDDAYKVIGEKLLECAAISG
ncbi:MAG: hypothetical protein Hyperionvirus24_14 [Hyperionvirus sp.]|uniref:J domain-containing protein n=1 Tax=Hyperionvirus sp. TaxID=2487770 RepID=A0A3G5AB86_9VIRU|nr:MAG: hypothetical protein Hyperionvirus24_14 [Hyperionvirus sp.]